jgi:hypothetical protein
MVFGSDAWELRTGDQFDVLYAIDGGPQISARAFVVSGRYIRVNLLDSSQLFDAFRRGIGLTIVARGRHSKI